MCRSKTSNMTHLLFQVLAKTNNDGRLMYRLCVAIENGEVPDKLANLRIGPLYGARWITFGARLLRLYVSQPDASAYEQEIIARMASYIIKVYFKVCFTFTFN